MFFDCRHVNNFWKDIYLLLRNQNIASVPFKKKDIRFGAYELNSDLLLINHIILEGKYYIFFVVKLTILVYRETYYEKIEKNLLH